MTQLNLVFLGPPGAGKGTQAQRISKKFGLKWISTGDMLRQAIKEGSELGKQAEKYMKKGELVPDEIVLGLLEQLLATLNNTGFILDGFPRTVPQAEKLDRVLEAKSLMLNGAVFIDVPDKEIIKRLSARRICPNCGAVYNMIYNPPKNDEKCDICGTPLIKRDDDKPETIQKRLKVYRNHTAPLLDYYKTKGILIRIDGTGTLDEITARIEEALMTIGSKEGGLSF